MRERPIEILLVEDNPADSDLMAEALEECRISNNLHVTRDGVKATEFLLHQGVYTDVPRPHLIMLDLNLPVKDGREVLAEVKNHPELKDIPVIILTTSASEEDIHTCYDLHANCFITKPTGVEELFDVVERIEDFWFSTARLPRRG